MAEAGSWPTIVRLGLLSTSALLDLFEITGATREAAESERRDTSTVLRHPVHGSAVLRDHGPMHDEKLRRCLRDGLTPRDWYRTLNRRVFFWVSEQRLMDLLEAKAYRGRRHTILTVPTARLLERFADRVTLSSINSGATLFNPAPRGIDTFRSIADYPAKERGPMKGGPAKPVVELTVDYSVPEVAGLVDEVREVGCGLPAVVLSGR
jgi:hypothetical protein